MDKSPVFSATTVGVCSCSSTLYHSSQTLTTLLAWRLAELSTNVCYILPTAEVGRYIRNIVTHRRYRYYRYCMVSVL